MNNPPQGQLQQRLNNWLTFAYLPLSLGGLATTLVIWRWQRLGVGGLALPAAGVGFSWGLAGAVLGVWLGVLVVYLGLRAERQVRHTRIMNQQLQAEIDQLRQVEAHLRTHEDRWQLVLRGNHAGIWDWNVSTNEVLFTENWKTLLGFKSEQISNQFTEWSHRVHPDDFPHVNQTLQDYFDRKISCYQVEYRLQCQDGTYKWILDRSQALWNEMGKAVRLVGSHTDITVRKQTELALQQSEARYRELVSHLNTGIMVHAPDTRIIGWNQKACDVLGLTREQLFGKSANDPIWHLVREDGTVMPLAEYPVNHVLTTQQPLHNRIVGVQHDRQDRRWMLVTAFPDFDAQQQLTQVVVTFIDITRLKQAEADLRSLTAVMEHAVSGIAQLDAAGRYRYVNQVYASRLGSLPVDLIGLDWHQTAHPEDLPQLQQAYQEMRQTGKVEVEARGRRQDGSIFYKQLVMVATNDEDQQFMGHYCFLKDISDRKQTEALLLQSEEKFRTAIDFTYNWEYWQAPDGTFIYVSPSCERITGYIPTEFIEYPYLLQKIVHPDDCDRFLQHDCTDVNMDGVMEFRIIHRNGEQRWISHVCQPVFNAAGVYLGRRASNRDVSERVQLTLEREAAVMALRQSEATKQAMIEAIPDLLIRMRVDGTYVDFVSNNNFNIINRDHIRQNVNVFDILQPDLAQLRLYYAQQALASGQTQTYEHEIDIDHQRYYEEVRIVPLLPDELLVMVRNISDRKQAEIDLRHQKEMFQAIVDHIPVMITLCDPQGQFELINPAVERIMGWSMADWQQPDFWTQCYPDTGDRQQVLNGIQAATGEWQELTTMTASRRLIATSWAHVRLSNGYGVGIGQDISDRKHREAVVLQAVAAAEAANRAKSMFLANMSHELRTPLNVILGFAEVMTHDPALTPTQLQDLQTIHRSGDHLLRLINDILDLSKIEAGHTEIEATGFDLIALLHAIRTMMTEQVKAKGLQLVFEIAPAVPQFVIADEHKLRQILLNLLSNAIKFTEQGCITVQVQATAVPETSALTQPAPARSPFVQLQFEVTDTGIGIAPADQTHIFDAFIQAEAGKQTVTGTGLGLTICRKLLELMQGEMTVHSVPQHGSTFQFSLPVPVANSAHLDQEHLDRVIVGLAPGQEPRRILVVDDEPANRLLLVRLMTHLGLEVQEAADGQEAIQRWQEWQPHLTWMDLRMPHLDGYEATKQIRSLAPTSNQVIIALTAQASQRDRALSLAAGCNDYVSKPFREQTLLLKLQEHLKLEIQYQAELSAPPVAALRSVAALDLQPFADPASPLYLSTAWLEAVEYAAMCCHDQAIEQLLQQLPPELAPLSQEIANLTFQFQFERILALMQQIKQQAAQMQTR